MLFEKMKLEHLGIHDEDGINVVGEIERKMPELAALVMNDCFQPKAVITLTISLERSAKSDGLVITANVAEKRPRRRRRGQTAFINKSGHLTINKAEQLELPVTRRVERADVKETE